MAYSLVAKESFNAAEDGIDTKHYNKGDKFKVTDKKFCDLLVSKGHAELASNIETKVTAPKETKSTKTK